MKMKAHLTCLILTVILQLQNNLTAQDARIWGSYFGGPSDEYNQAIATDDWGNVYIAGFTNSTTGIAVGGFQNTNAGNTDAYLAKIDNSGNLIWSTYYGGTLNDYGKGVVIDANGNIYLCGTTSSGAGIAMGGMQNIFGGGSSDAFLVKFDSTGARIWATYLGGSGYEEGYGIGKDNLGNIFMTGSTSSSSSIALAGFDNTFSGGMTDAYLVKFDGTGTVLWGTYYGDTGDEWGWSIAADTTNDVYLSGATSSASGIASGGFQNTLSAGYDDAFLVKFDESGSRLWATYYGNTGNEEGTGVCTDEFGDVYLAGFTESTSGISSGGFQNTFGGGITDLFLVKFNSAGNRLWATYYGGGSDEESGNVVTDALGFIYLAGDTYSVSGIASGGYQDSLTGIENQLAVRFAPDGTRQCATYYGQVHDEFGNVAADNFGNIFICGSTQGLTGIAVSGFQNSYGGGLFDSYVVKLSTCNKTLVEEFESSQIKIYPNPATKNCTIESNNEFMIEGYEIKKITGELIREVKIHGAHSLTIELNELENGSYLIGVKSKDKKYYNKIVVVN